MITPKDLELDVSVVRKLLDKHRTGTGFDTEAFTEALNSIVLSRIKQGLKLYGDGNFDGFPLGSVWNQERFPHDTHQGYLITEDIDVNS